MHWPALCCDRQALQLQDRLEEEKLQEKLPKQIHVNECSTQIPTCAILHVSVFLMIGVLLYSAWALKTNLKCFGFGVL